MAEKKEIEVPLGAWVRGGTTRSSHDRLVQQQQALTTERREQQDAQFRATKTGKLPEHLRGPDMNPGDAQGIARTSSLKLGGRSHASVVLGYKHPKDNLIIDWMTCELWEQPWDHPTREGNELFLEMVCLNCLWSRGRPMGDCQFHMRQSNRRFWLETKQAGEVWVNPKNPAEVVTLAGTIEMGGEKATCGECGWRFTIDKSIIHDDGRCRAPDR